MYPTQAAQAYDRAITVFSPDGRLFQVEYAREAVKRGTTAVGIIYENGVLLGVDKASQSKLIVPESIEKIFKVDEHLGIATSGLVADARRLVEDARVSAQRSRLAYNEPISSSTLTRELCNTKQMYTQYAGARPFGAALLVAGVNEESKLFETDPSGAFTEFSATAIGMGKPEVEKVFEKYYREGSGRKEAIELALRGLNRVATEPLRKENLEMITIEAEREYSPIGMDELGKLLSGLSKELKKGKK